MVADNSAWAVKFQASCSRQTGCVECLSTTSGWGFASSEEFDSPCDSNCAECGLPSPINRIQSARVVVISPRIWSIRTCGNLQNNLLPSLISDFMSIAFWGLVLPQAGNSQNYIYACRSGYKNIDISVMTISIDPSASTRPELRFGSSPPAVNTIQCSSSNAVAVSLNLPDSINLFAYSHQFLGAIRRVILCHLRALEPDYVVFRHG